MQENRKISRKLIILPVAVALICIVAYGLYYMGYIGNRPMIDRLSSIKGVISVEKIEQPKEDDYYSGMYIVTFEMPIDWSDPSVGTFPQRVHVAIREGADISVMETNGYCLLDKMYGSNYLPHEAYNELAGMLNGSYVGVEYRFSGLSRPEDLSDSGIKYWEYLTPENSAKDYHRIYKALKPVLGRRWVAFGTSQGGLLTNIYGYFYPKDMLVYVSYSAPCLNGIEDPRISEFVNNEIGDDVYGEKKAKEMRDTLLAFTVEAMRYKEDNLPLLEKAVSDNGCILPDGSSCGQFYDNLVMDYSMYFWQVDGDYDKVIKILNMPDATDHEKKEKAEAVNGLLYDSLRIRFAGTNSIIQPYCIFAAKYSGMYAEDYSYLRKALKEEGLEGTLSVTEDMEKGFWKTGVFTEEQRETFTYDGSFMQSFAASIDATPAKHLMIYGVLDPWYSVATPAHESENIKIFVHPTLSHTVFISDLPEDMQEDAINTLYEWVAK